MFTSIQVKQHTIQLSKIFLSHQYYFYWKIIALQLCVGFCHTTVQIRHEHCFPLFFLIYFYQLEANYFTTLQWVLSYIDMNQPWIYMCSPSRSPLPPCFPFEPPLLPPIPPLQVITEHGAGIPVLYSRFPLVIHFIHDSV